MYADNCSPLSYSASLFFKSSICFCRYNFSSAYLLVSRSGRTGLGLQALIGTGLTGLTGLDLQALDGTGLTGLTGLDLLCVVGTDFLNLGG